MVVGRYEELNPLAAQHTKLATKPNRSKWDTLLLDVLPKSVPHSRAAAKLQGMLRGALERRRGEPPGWYSKLKADGALTRRVTAVEAEARLEAHRVALRAQAAATRQAETSETRADAAARAQARTLTKWLAEKEGEAAKAEAAAAAKAEADAAAKVEEEAIKARERLVAQMLELRRDMRDYSQMRGAHALQPPCAQPPCAQPATLRLQAAERRSGGGDEGGDGGGKLGGGGEGGGGGRLGGGSGRLGGGGGRLGGGGDAATTTAPG